jgi:hypothetical protein
MAMSTPMVAVMARALKLGKVTDVSSSTSNAA